MYTQFILSVVFFAPLLGACGLVFGKPLKQLAACAPRHRAGDLKKAKGATSPGFTHNRKNDHEREGL